MIGGVIVTRLRADITVTGLVVARTWFENAPSAPANPYIVVHHIFTERPTHLRGDTSVAKGRYQVNCYGITAASAASVASAVKASLHGIIDTAFGAVHVESSRVINEQAIYTEPQSNQNLGLFGQMVEAEIWYRE